DTLFTVLETLTRVAAPLAPLVTEEIWRGLTGGRSVHLTDWPDPALFPADDDLVGAMDGVREIASAGLALRKAKNLRVRLPLASLTVVGGGAGLEPFVGILRDELNVKSVQLVDLTEDSLTEFGITRRLSVNARALGPRLGKEVQRVIRAAKDGFWTQTGDTVEVDGEILTEGEFELVLESRDEHGAISFLSGGGFVLLDTATTPELEAEGLARDIVRAVQQASKDAGLDVSDRISLTITGDDAAVAAATVHRDLIAAETLATALDVALGDGKTAVGVDSHVSIELER